MRKGCDEGKREKREKTGGKTRRKKKKLMIIVATTSLPAVDPPNANRWNAARACQNPENIEKKTLVGRKKEGDRIQYKEDNF